MGAWFGRGKRAAQKFVYGPPVRQEHDLLKFITHVAKPMVRRQLQDGAKSTIEKAGLGVKFQVEIQVKFVKLAPALSEGGETEYVEHAAEPWFISPVQSLLVAEVPEEILELIFEEILDRVDAYHREGSGWTFEKVNCLQLILAEFTPFRGGGSVNNCNNPRLPHYLRCKKACLGPPETGANTCFRDCMLMAERGVGGRNPTTRKKINAWLEKTRLNFSDLSFPTPLNQLNTFERLNPGLALTIFIPSTTKRKGAPPVRVVHMSRNYSTGVGLEERRNVDLLLWCGHYFLIRNLSRLLGVQTSKSKKFVCRSCFCTFPSEKRRLAHWKTCCAQKAQHFHTPLRKTTTHFDQFAKMTMTRFVIYYDFETMQVPCAEDAQRKQHVAIAVAAIRICHDCAELNSPLFHHVGADCVEAFIGWLERQTIICETINDVRDMPLRMTAADWDFFKKQNKCQMCRSTFDAFCPPVKDHCHLSGKFRYALCNRCNFTYAGERALQIPCFAHGATHFDQHLLVAAMVARNKKCGRPPPRILPRNTEHYLAIYNGPLVFLDSYEFMKSSLASIVDSMKGKTSTIGSQSGIAFPLLFRFLRASDEKYQLMCKKGIFCYDYLDKAERLDETRLPTREQFYDSLKDSAISEQQYKQAEEVWRKMDCRTLGDYLLVYLFSDVLLLADCFERFRVLSMAHFQMDVAKFMTLPHFAFHAMLKKTEVSLEVMQDIEMVQWFKRGVRGGVASIMKRYAAANTPILGENYDSTRPRREIVMLDCTNLYGHALSKVLPEKDFRWLSEEEIARLEIESLSHKSPIGYVLEVDLDYPPELHREHSMYPLAPHRVAIPPAQWSDHTYKLAQALQDIGVFKIGQEKLVPDLTERRNYIVHYQNLKFYLAKGMRLRRIHRAVAFRQRAWMHDFVEFITVQRAKAVSEFESSFWKLILNSIYGRLLMDKGKHVSMKLIDDVKVFQKCASKPNFKSVTFYNSDFVGVQIKPESIELGNPVAVGFAVLELSKCHMYKFHYNHALPILGGPSRCQLLMTDTDSLAYEVEGGDDPKELLARVAPQYFDFSNFPPDHALYDAGNRKIKGTFKFEHAAQTISHFVGIRPKMYCFRFAGDDNSRQDDVAKAKGIPRMALNKLRFEDYCKALVEPGQTQTCHFQCIRSKKHQLYTLKAKKKSLSSLDTKRWLCDDGINTLAHGDFRCRRNVDHVGEEE